MDPKNLELMKEKIMENFVVDVFCVNMNFYRSKCMFSLSSGWCLTEKEAEDIALRIKKSNGYPENEFPLQAKALHIHSSYYVLDDKTFDIIDTITY